MKYKEFHRIVRRNGWTVLRQEGSHIIYQKEGCPNYPVPYHGAKEIPEPLKRKISKDMGLK